MHLNDVPIKIEFFGRCKVTVIDVAEIFHTRMSGVVHFQVVLRLTFIGANIAFKRLGRQMPITDVLSEYGRSSAGQIAESAFVMVNVKPHMVLKQPHCRKTVQTMSTLEPVLFDGQLTVAVIRIFRHTDEHMSASGAGYCPFSGVHFDVRVYPIFAVGVRFTVFPQAYVPFLAVGVRYVNMIHFHVIDERLDAVESLVAILPPALE